MAHKYPSSKQFKKDIDNNRLDSIYLFMGEEEGEKDKFINRLLETIFKDTDARANSTSRFHIENDEFMQAADFALSQSMFYSCRVCIMYNIESLKGNDISLFNDLAENLPDSTRLIMTTSDKKPPSFITKEFIKKIKVVQFWKYFDSDIYNYIIINIKKLGLEIDEMGVNLLIELTGKDIKKIDDSLDMIRFSGETGLITIETIKNFISDVKDVSIFDFIDSLYKKESRALKLFKKIFEDGTPELRILYMISRQAEIIEKYYSLIDEGRPSDDAMNECGVYSRNRENFWQHTKLFPPRKLKKIFPKISSTDFKIKSGGTTKELISNPVFNLVSDILFQV